MDSRIHGKCPRISRYKFPYYITIIGELIDSGTINIMAEEDGNRYVSFDRKRAGELYDVFERVLLIPKDSIEEIYLNREEHQLDVYTFHTVSSYGLENLERNYRVGYGLQDTIGIHIDIKPEHLILTQLQICVNKHGTYPTMPQPEREMIK